MCVCINIYIYTCKTGDPGHALSGNQLRNMHSKKNPRGPNMPKKNVYQKYQNNQGQQRTNNTERTNNKHKNRTSQQNHKTNNMLALLESGARISKSSENLLCLFLLAGLVLMFLFLLHVFRDWQGSTAFRLLSRSSG